MASQHKVDVTVAAMMGFCIGALVMAAIVKSYPKPTPIEESIVLDPVKWECWEYNNLWHVYGGEATDGEQSEATITASDYCVMYTIRDEE